MVDCLFSKNVENFLIIFNKWTISNIHQFGNNTSQFDLTSEPPISLEVYMRRLIELTECEIVSAIYSLVLVERFTKNTGILLTATNKHRVLFVSLLCSIKLLEDKIYPSLNYSKISGINLKILIGLERIFLLALKYEVLLDIGILKEFLNDYKP